MEILPTKTNFIEDRIKITSRNKGEDMGYDEVPSNNNYSKIVKQDVGGSHTITSNRERLEYIIKILGTLFVTTIIIESIN